MRPLALSALDLSDLDLSDLKDVWPDRVGSDSKLRCRRAGTAEMGRTIKRVDDFVIFRVVLSLVLK